jgi:rubrerythrin
VLCELLASFTLFVVAAIGGQNFHSVQANSKPMTKQVNDYIVNDYKKPMTKEGNDSIVNESTTDNGKKKVGATYSCENCGTEYSARTVWQKFCPACSSERKKGVLLAKSRKVKQVS